MQIIRLVVNKIVEGGGRFLKKDVRHNQWYDGGVVCGKDKVRCCLEVWGEKSSLLFTAARIWPLSQP